MPRKIQIVLAVTAVLLLVAGAFQRMSSLGALSSTFRIIASLKMPTVQDLGYGLDAARPIEVSAEVLLAVGGILLALAVSPVVRSPKAVGLAIALIVAAGAITASSPATNIAGVVMLDRTNASFFYPSIVALGDDALHVFVMKEPDRDEWYVEDDTRGIITKLDVAAYADVIMRKLERKPRPVTIYLVDSCQGKRRSEFLAATKEACDYVRMPCKVGSLPTEEELHATWHAEAYSRRDPFTKMTLLGTLARLASAAAFALLALVAWRAGARTPLEVGLGLLALAALLATPLPLYDAVGPGATTGCPTYKEAWEHLGLYRTLVLLSAAAVPIGAIAVAIGLRAAPVAGAPALPPRRRSR